MIEDLATHPDAAIAMQQFYGQQLYKCPRIYCRSFHEGFVTAAQRDSHVERHDRSHLCSTAGCLYATLGFPKAGELDFVTIGSESKVKRRLANMSRSGSLLDTLLLRLK
jgi:hypothetical protein